MFFVVRNEVMLEQTKLFSLEGALKRHCGNVFMMHTNQGKPSRMAARGSQKKDGASGGGWRL